MTAAPPPPRRIARPTATPRSRASARPSTSGTTPRRRCSHRVRSATTRAATASAISLARSSGAASVLERILHQDRVVALGAGREERDRAFDQLLEILHILDRLGGK